MAEFTVEVKGMKELEEALTNIERQFKVRGVRAVQKAVKDTADHIKNEFVGDGKGFKDRTGALRRSIDGDVFQDQPIDNEIVGYVWAGDDQLGTDNLPTREYVTKVEFSEFSWGGKNTNDTSFLRAGVMQQSRQIAKTIIEFLKPDNLL